MEPTIKQDGLIDDAKTKAGEWLDDEGNQKQVGGWVAQGIAWILGLFGSKK